MATTPQDVDHQSSLREQAIARITKMRDAEMAIAAVYSDDERYSAIASWHMGEAGAYQCVLDALKASDSAEATRELEEVRGCPHGNDNCGCAIGSRHFWWDAFSKARNERDALRHQFIEETAALAERARLAGFGWVTLTGSALAVARALSPVDPDVDNAADPPGFTR